MAIPQAEHLLEQAQKGVRLGSRDRRHVIAYLMATRPETTNAAMAELFKVSERMIRMDRKTIKTKKAQDIKEEDIGLVIADIALCFEKQVRDMEASKYKCKLGTNSYLNHCRAIFNTQLMKVKALQELGYYPRNLGTLAIDKYEYRAIVMKDGSVNTLPVNMVIDAEVLNDDEPVKQLEAPEEPKIDFEAFMQERQAELIEMTE